MTVRLLVLLASFPLFVGCGGGSGGGGGGNNSGGNGPITAQNAPLVVSVSQSAIDDSIDSGADGTRFFVASATRTGGFNLAQFAIDQVVRLRNSSKSLPAAIVIQAAIPLAEPCTGGGEIIGVWNDNGDFVDSAGDTYDITFANCIEGGESLNGSVAIALNELTGDPASGNGEYTIDAAFVFNNLSFNDGIESGAIDGDIRVASDRASNIETITVNSTLLTLTHTALPSNPVTTLSGFSVTETFNVTTGAYSDEIAGSVNDSRVGFNVTADTIVPFAANSATEPTSGSSRLTAGDGSNVTVTAVGGDDVRLDVDTDGNGTIDSVINTTWTALGALL